MGLWTVVPERLQSPMCSLYKAPLQLIEQGSTGTISVIQAPINTMNEFVSDFKSDLNIANKSTNQNTKESNKKDIAKYKINDKLSKYQRYLYHKYHSSVKFLHF